MDTLIKYNIIKIKNKHIINNYFNIYSIVEDDTAIFI